MLDKSIILILDPRGIISSGGTDTFLRHQRYQDELKQSSKDTSYLVVLTRKQSFPGPSDISLEIHEAASLLEWFKMVLKYLRSNSLKVKWLVAGEPWITFWICFAFRNLWLKNSKLQLQVHGDFGNPVWRESSSKRKILYLFFVIALKLSDSVRAVGTSQANFLSKSLGESSRKVFVSPVESSIGDLVSMKAMEPITLGLVGRLEFDRGLVAFVTFVRCLYRSNKNFKILVIGSGSKKRWLENRLLFLGERAVFMGQLSHSDLQPVWGDISVLCSFAPVESFGRSSREALSRGIRVLGIDSSGLRDLKDFLGVDSGLVVLDRSFTCSDVNEAIVALKKSKISQNVPLRLREESKDARKALVLSWL
jgi:glycosyltransferase involved in cell wall biosynthesis